MLDSTRTLITSFVLICALALTAGCGDEEDDGELALPADPVADAGTRFNGVPSAGGGTVQGFDAGDGSPGGNTNPNATPDDVGIRTQFDTGTFPTGDDVILLPD